MRFAFPILLLLLLIGGCKNSNSEVSPPQQSSQVSAAPSNSESKPQPQLQPVIKINNIAGKTSDEVAEYLGAPTSTETVNPSRTPCPCEKNFYKNGEIRIVFIEGKADWIKISDLNDAPYSAETLTMLGIEQKSPSFSNENVIRWTNIPGLLEVSIFPAQESVSYAYIKTATP